MTNNIVFIYSNQYLHNPHFRKDVPVIYAENIEEIEKYLKRTGDKSKIIIIDDKIKQFKREINRIYKKVVKSRYSRGYKHIVN
jgi:Mg2+ and Co2+ transporter CorA